MSSPSIVQMVVDSMILAQREKPINKKEFVLLLLRSALPQDVYERYLPLLEILIDELKALSKSDLLQKLKNKKCSCINI